MPPDTVPTSDQRTPEDLRQGVAAYVAAFHRAYGRAAQMLPPALSGGLPLASGERFWVAAVAARDLHVVATSQPFGPTPGPEGTQARIATVDAEDGPLRWRLMFYDPVVLPHLGLIGERGAAAGAAVRDALGVRTWLYHLMVEPGSELNEHRATHAGTALAHTPAQPARDFEAIKAHAGRRADLATEMEGAALAGLPRAQALLALALVPGDEAVRAAAAKPEPDPDELRRVVLAGLRDLPREGTVRAFSTSEVQNARTVHPGSTSGAAGVAP